FAPEGYRMMGGGGIKRGFAWKVLIGPFVLVPLAAKYPLTWRSLCSAFAYQLCHVIFTGTGSGVDIVGAIGRAEKVNVGVNETGSTVLPRRSTSSVCRLP